MCYEYIFKNKVKFGNIKTWFYVNVEKINKQLCEI